MARKKSSSETTLPPAHEEPILPAVNPAIKDHGTPLDSPPFPIVAAGASAGGLEAFNEFLKALPMDTGMAFVLIQHMAPDHDSLLPDILARATRLPVLQVANNIAVKPNHVYVIPPGKSMVIGHGLLQLAPRTEARGQARPIDHFMRSLAEEHGHKAIGVVLSGTGSDGTLGLQEIKAAGGITFAQDNTAEHIGMPRSAIATGAVDFVLPPEEIARELGRIARHPYIGQVDADDPSIAGAAAMVKILDILRQGTGVDFANYKRNTLFRRITRRMVLQKLDSLDAYFEFMRANAVEVDALYQDVLIGVTSFFRNADAYEALKTAVFPKLIEGRNRHEQVRVWALGCSTGEEAYSIAMTYVEFAEKSGTHVPMQVFATDLNSAGIENARAGLYPKGIAQDVSPERLRRFFVEVDGHFRVAKPIRDMCIFARQNALADPPFSRLDLVACRNMLIYLDSSLQQRLIPILHYSLRGAGFLWLGASETIGTYRDLFELVDSKHKIYEKRAGAREALKIPLLGRRGQAGTLSGTDVQPTAATDPNEPQREADRILLNRYAPPGVVVNEHYDIVQFRGDTGAFLTPAPGRASLNLLKMLREGLMVAVRGALQRAKREGLPVREPELRVKHNGQWREVDIVAIPLRAPSAAPGSVLVLFEEPIHSVEGRMRQMDELARSARDTEAQMPSPERESKDVARLKQELSATRDYLQSVIEQQEAANEELQSANEEIQSANEELQSINEEIETSKEEIQASNEELATVNDELQNRNRELAVSNDDFTNLLASVQIAIVMLGPDLRIRRFTPAAEKLLNLIPADLGLPLGDMNLGVNIPDLDAIVLDVIETMRPRERDVQDREGRWHSLRVRPYRTADSRIDGAVILFVDIDELKRADQALRESEARFEVLANQAPAMIWLNDLAGPRFVNRAYEDFVGASESQIRAAERGRYIHPEDATSYLARYEEALRGGKPFEARARFRRADGEYRWMKSVGVPRIMEGGSVVGFVGCTFDITDMKEAESALIELDRGKNEFLAMLAHELRNPLSGVHNASRLLARTEDPSLIHRARSIIDRQTAHMVRMVNDLLDVSRLTHGKIALNLEPVDVAAVMRRSVEATVSERESSLQSVTVDLPEDPVWVRGDAMRLEQVFCNLLNNASKFTRHEGSIWVSVERESAGKPRRDAWATIRVRDNGSGIEAALLPRIFDLFVQSDHFSERGRTGIGLGLTLARRLVELQGGTIEARSAGAAAGSEFIVRIPLLPKSEIPARDASRAARRPAAAPRRILIVDDNRDSAESLGLMFTLAGHTVKVIHEGGAAPPAAEEFKPDAILLDIGLPDMDGYRVARALRDNHATRETLIVATTGYGRQEDVRKSREAGIDEHMTKPIDPDRLMDFIQRGRASPAPAE